MTWTCPAITNGVAIYDDGKIRPCCQVNWEYHKPISEINNPNRFSDIDPDKHCDKCIRAESLGFPSYKQHFVKLEKQNPKQTTAIKFLDSRESNLCNAKCRTCGPHHSSKWHQEQTNVINIKQIGIDEYLDTLLTEDLIHIYFAGGEPLMRKSHYDLLEKCVSMGISSKVNLMYSTNLSTLTYKDKKFFSLWKCFKSIKIMGSADGVGPVYNAMRSDLDWTDYLKNAEFVVNRGINFSYHLTVSNLNIWFLDDIVKFIKDKQWVLTMEIVYGPEELTLECIPEHLVGKAMDIVNACGDLLPTGKKEDLLSRLNCSGLIDFKHTLAQQKMYDIKRNENLTELLKQKGIE